MGLKGKIISTCVMIALTLCSAIAIGFAYSNPGINISSPTSFNVDAGVQATISTTVKMNNENINIGQNGSLTILATDSKASHDLNIPEQSFTKSGDTLVYSYTITNTQTEDAGSNFVVDMSFEQPEDELNGVVSITSNFSTLSEADKTLENNESITITFTITLESEAKTFNYDPSISFSLSKI